MSDSAKSWGTIQTDADTSRDFVLASPAWTVRATGIKARSQSERPRFVFVVVPQDGGAYQVVRWFELEQLVETASGAAAINDATAKRAALTGGLELTLADLLKGEPPIQAFERGSISYQDAFSLRRKHPRQCLLVLEGGKPLGVFASPPRSGIVAPELLPLLPVTSTLPAPGGVLGIEDEQPQERQINAWIDGNKGGRGNPLAKGKRYILHFDIDRPKAEALAGGVIDEEAIRKLAEGQAVVDVTFMLDWDQAQLAVLGPQEWTIPLPVEQGPSEFEALFQIKPLVEGEITLDGLVFVKGQLLQKLTITLQTAAEEASAVAGFMAAAVEEPPQVVVSGRTLGSMAVLRPRSNPVSLIISPTLEGYNLVLTGATVSRANIKLNDYGVAELVQKARNELRKIVYGETTGNKSYLMGWDIKPEDHQVTLEALARIGRDLFRGLFQKSGSEARQMGDLLQKLSQDGVQLNIEVVAQNFIFPWALVYDKPGTQPASADGFWGFKHIIHHLPEASFPAPVAFRPVIPVTEALNLTFVFNEGIDKQMGRPLIASQREFFKEQLKGIVLTERASEEDLIAALADPQSPIQILYIYCHAESYVPGERDKANVAQFVSDSRLLIDTKKGVSVSDLEDRTDITVALESAPLVYINACQSGELSPFMATEGLVPFFIRKGARGVLGTEVDTPALFAAEFAKRFFARFVEGGITMGDLLLELRKEFLEKHNNVMGLLYSLYSSGDVIVERAA